MAINGTALRGIYTAIPTPLLANGGVNVSALRSLVQYLCDAGVSGVVPAGGTGEYVGLSDVERVELVTECVEAARGRCHVIPGVLAAGVSDAITTGKQFADVGADALMVVTPYYSGSTESGIRQYFNEFSKRVDCPLLLYEIPKRTGVSVGWQTVQKMIDEDGSIIGMKACSTDIESFTRLMQTCQHKAGILSGSEMLFPAHVLLGASGGVLATSTIFPRRWKEIFQLLADGQIAKAMREHNNLVPFIDAVFSEPNPAALKFALTLLNIESGPVRLPVVPASAGLQGRIRTLYTQLTAQ